MASNHKLVVLVKNTMRHLLEMSPSMQQKMLYMICLDNVVTLSMLSFLEENALLSSLQEKPLENVFN